MSKSGMLISAPSAPSANGSAASIFGTSDPKLAWRNFTAANSAQAPPGHSVGPWSWSDAPSRSVRRGLPGEPDGLTTGKAPSVLPPPSPLPKRRVSLPVLVVWTETPAACHSLPFPQRRWSLGGRLVQQSGPTEWSTSRRTGNTEWLDRRVRRTMLIARPTPLPCPERSSPATAHPSAPRRPNCTTAEGPRLQLEVKCPKAAPTRSLSL